MQQRLADYQDRLKKLEEEGTTDEEKREERLRIIQQIQIMTQGWSTKATSQIEAVWNRIVMLW